MRGNLPVGRVMQAGEPRSSAIESLRAVAALGVVFAHTLGVARTFHGRDPGPPSGAFERLITSGTYSVYLFFVLSGYLLFLPFAKRAFAGGSRIDLRRYATNRALRILPVYYAALVVYLVVAGKLTAHQLLVFGTFSENFSSTTIQTVNPVLWSLVIELHFYLLLPLLALVVARVSGGSIRRGLALVVGLGLASLALRWSTLYAHPAGADPILRFSLPSCFMFFAAGMTLALMRLSWERRPPRVLAGFLGGAGLWVGGAVATWLLLAYGKVGGQLAAVASFLLVGAVVLPLRNRGLRTALGWRPLAALGVASYSLYIWHVLIVRRISEHFFLTGFAELLVYALPVCIAAALVSYALVERPFLLWRRRWGAASAAPAAPDPAGSLRGAAPPAPAPP